MKLSRAEQSTLVVAITEAVQATQVTKVGSVFFEAGDWELKTLQSLDKDTAVSLRRHLDDGGLQALVRNELHRAFLLSEPDLPAEGRIPLSSYAAFGDALKVAKDIVRIIESLPLQYRLVCRASIPISDLADREDVDLRISDQLRLVSGSKLPGEFALEHPAPLIDAHIQRGHEVEKRLAIIPNQLYFEYRTSGYVSDRYNSRLGRDFSDDLRAFYGACIAFDLLFSFGFTFDEQPILMALSKVGEGADELVQFERAETDVVKSSYFDTRSAIDKAIREQTASLEELLKPVLRMFSGMDRIRLCTAAVWLHRAYLSPRQMDKILESTIAVEVLLGDRDTSDRIGLSRLMANRCAYSLGQTTAERKEITDFFSSFYKVRSEIVHSGRLKMSEEDKKVVDKGLNLAARMLRHEIQLAAAE